MLVTTSIALACPNFTGTYRDNQGGITEYVQSGCESIKVFSSNEPAIEVVTDGVMREVLNQTINENGVEVKVIINMQATFTATELIVNSIAHAEANGQVFESSGQSVVTQLSNGNMKTITTNSDGSVTTSIDTKIN